MNNEKEYTLEEIHQSLIDVENMDHLTMCKYWRFQPKGKEIYFRKDLPAHEAFHKRLFIHFGGFTTEISKQLGH